MKNGSQKDIIEIVKKLGVQLEKSNDLLAVINEKQHLNNKLYYSFQPLSMACGLPSLCLFYGELQSAFPEEKWDEIGHVYLKKMVDEIRTHGIHSLSLFSGASGIGFSVISLSQERKYYNELIISINKFIKNKVHEFLDAPLVRNVLSYDVIEGMSGVLNYLIQFSNEMNYEIEAILRWFIEFSKPVKYKTTWVSGWFCEQPQSKEITINTGIAHGISGVIIAVCKAVNKGFEINGIGQVIRDMVNILLKYKMIQDTKVIWPTNINILDFINGEMSHQRHYYRDAWCYGAPGTCFALIMAGKTLKDKRCTELGINILHNSLNNISNIFAPTFCHGYAGLLQIVNSLECLIETKQEFQKEKEHLTDILLNYYDSDYKYGFYDIEYSNGKPQKYNNFGLLQGSIGTCLSLLNSKVKTNGCFSNTVML